MTSTLEVRGLSKSYGAFAAVDSFSHSFRSGEITTIVGPSGSGKSTTLWLIAGLSRPDAGQVLIDGVDVTRDVAERRGVGMVFQSYALFPHLTVQQNVEFGLRVRNAPKSERQARAAEVLRLVKMHTSADRRVQTLSGGEQQRVALARALAFEPRVLLMDEPLSALDAKLREELRDELLRLLGDLRLTTVYVTHDQSEAMGLGSELIVMNRGRIEQAGVPAHVYRAPATLFAAGFLGAANILEGTHAQGSIRLPFVSVPASGPMTDGACSVMIRPEDLELVQHAEAPEEARNRGTVFTAQVESIAFLGSHLRVTAVAAGQRLLIDARSDAIIDHHQPLPLRIRPGKVFAWTSGEQQSPQESMSQLTVAARKDHPR